MIIICKQLQLQVTIINTNDFHLVIWFQVFLSNTNNFEIDLFDPLMGSQPLLLFGVAWEYWQ